MFGSTLALLGAPPAVGDPDIVGASMWTQDTGGKPKEKNVG